MADFRQGKRLGAGIYAYGALHIDVLAAGGDPDSAADCETARRVAMKTAERLGIPGEVRDDG